MRLRIAIGWERRIRRTQLFDLLIVKLNSLQSTPGLEMQGTQKS